jgi:hypothetical protein
MMIVQLNIQFSQLHVIVQLQFILTQTISFLIWMCSEDFELACKVGTLLVARLTRSVRLWFTFSEFWPNQLNMKYSEGSSLRHLSF